MINAWLWSGKQADYGGRARVLKLGVSAGRGHRGFPDVQDVQVCRRLPTPSSPRASYLFHVREHPAWLPGLVRGALLARLAEWTEVILVVLIFITVWGMFFLFFFLHTAGKKAGKDLEQQVKQTDKAGIDVVLVGLERAWRFNSLSYFSDVRFPELTYC